MFLILLPCVFFSSYALANLYRNPALLDTVLSMFPLGKVLGMLLVFISCFILIIWDEDSMWNTIHPSKKFTIKAFSRKQFPAAGLVWLIPKEYIYYMVSSAFLYGLASIIAGYSMWFWLWYFLAMLIMNLITIPIEQAKNKKSGAEKDIEEYVRANSFFEGKLDKKGELIPEKAKVIVVRIVDSRMYISVADIQIINPRGRYSEEYSQSDKNPDLLENRVTREINSETTIESLIK